VRYASTGRGQVRCGRIIAGHACVRPRYSHGVVGGGPRCWRIPRPVARNARIRGQPAEEVLPGRPEAMVGDGLLTRFPRPDFMLAIHDTNLLACGQNGGDR